MGFMLAVAGVVIAAVVIAFALRSGGKAKPADAPAPAPARKRIEIDNGQAPPAAPATPPVAADEPPPPELSGFRMAMPGELDEARRAELLEGLARISLPPRSLQELMSPEFLASGASRDLAEFIMREPVLTAKVLGRVNSPFYALQSPIVSVQHAITFLGMNAVRTMAIKFMLEEAFSTEDPQTQALCSRIWDAGMVAADLCVLLSQKLGFTDTGASSTQTVLSFVGDFALMGLLPPDVAAQSWEHRLLERTRLQQEALGINATVAGRLLLEKWQLPEGIVSGVESIGTLLVTPAPAAPGPRELRLALCYCCARIGESIALGRVNDVAQVDLAAGTQPEYHHVRSYLRRPEFARFAEHLQAPDTRVALSRMIGAASPARA
jgi:HD-like signal output (HDOD) protein